MIIGGNIDEEEWAQKATSYMQYMMKVVSDMKAAANEQPEELMN